MPRASLTQQGRLGRRPLEVVGEDGGRPICCLPHPQEYASDTQLVGFHLSLPMRYIGSAPFFCMVTETVAELANDAISQKEQVGKHPFDLAAKFRAANDTGALEAQADARWGHLLAEQRSAAKANVGVYLDDFVSVV